MTRKIRVFRIQHSFVETTNHRLLDELARFPELDMRCLCPEWGVESGNRRELKTSPRPDLDIGKTMFTSHYATTFYIQKLGIAIRKFRPHILSVHEEPWSLTMGQALFFGKTFAPDARLVFNSAQNIFKKYPFPFSAIEQATYRTAAAGYGCCEGVREVVRARGFRGPFDVIPLGLDPDLFAFRKREIRDENRPFVIGYMGQLVEEKGVFTLLRAFTMLDGRPRLLLLGGGPDMDKLRAAAAKAGVADRVEMPGPLPHADVPAAMDRVDVLVVPSQTTPKWKEQFGRVISESMSMGVPVIGSDSGSIPEVVGDAGLIFPEKNHDTLAALLRDLMAHPEQLVHMSEQGRRRAMERFTWKRVAEMTRDVYLRAMEAQG